MQDLGLALESRQAFVVLGEFIRQDFDRHIPTELSVSRPIHVPHPTLADGLEDLVVREFVTSFERHGVDDITTMAHDRQPETVAVGASPLP